MSLTGAIRKQLQRAKETECAMIGVEMELNLNQRQEIMKLGYHIAASRKFGKYIVTWPQEKRAEELRAKVQRKMEAKSNG